MDRTAHAIQTATALSRTTDQLVRRDALLAQGLSGWVVDNVLNIGAMHRALPGIYLVGRDVLTRRQLLRLATMIGPGRCWLTARTGLEARDVLWPRKSEAVVCTTLLAKPERRQATLPVDDGSPGTIRIVPLVRTPPHELAGDLPAATVARCLVDLAAAEGQRMLKIGWDQAEYRGLLNLPELDREVSGPRRAGRDELAALVSRRRILTGVDTDLRSPKELPFLHQIVEFGLPVPLVNFRIVVQGFEFFLDFYWPDPRFALELDSPDHLRAEAGARDRNRDALLATAGIQVTRFLDADALASPDLYLPRLRDAMQAREALLHRAA